MRCILITLSCLNLFFVSYGQKVDNCLKGYEDFVIIDSLVSLLDKCGNLKRFDFFDSILHVKDTLAFDAVVVTKDRKGNLVVGDKSNNLKVLEEGGWRNILSCNSGILGVAFNSKNEAYAITRDGVWGGSFKKALFPDTSLNKNTGRVLKGWFANPVVFVDRSDNIWIAFGHGEWGGEVFIFDTRLNKFFLPGIDAEQAILLPVKCFFESAGGVYAITGISHMSSVRSAVVCLDKSKSEVICHRSNEYSDTGNYEIEKDEACVDVDIASVDETGRNVCTVSSCGIFKADIDSLISNCFFNNQVVDFNSIINRLGLGPEGVRVLKVSFFKESLLLLLKGGLIMIRKNGVSFLKG